MAVETSIMIALFALAVCVVGVVAIPYLAFKALQKRDEKVNVEYRSGG